MKRKQLALLLGLAAGAAGVLVFAGSDAGASQLTVQPTWSQSFPGYSNEVGYDCVTDRAGNVIVVGNNYSSDVDFGGDPVGSNGWRDVVVAKFTSGGTHLWSQNFGGTDQDVGGSCATDPAGNVIVSGSVASGSVDFGGGPLAGFGDADAFVLKLDPNGNHLWSRRFGGGYTDIAAGCATDLAGNVLVVGHFKTTVDFGGGPIAAVDGSDVFAVKFDPEGNHLWSRGMGGVGGDYAAGCAVDLEGNLLITGNFQGDADFGGGAIASEGANDVFLVKLDQGGRHVWSRGFGCVNCVYSDEAGKACATDDEGSVIVTGSFRDQIDFGGGLLTNPNSMSAAFLVKFDAEGAHQWSHAYSGARFNFYEGLDCATGPDGEVLMSGYFGNVVDFGGGPIYGNGEWDTFVALFDRNGTHQWSDGFGAGDKDYGRGCAIGPWGGLYLTGEFVGTASFGGIPLTAMRSSDIYLAKFSASSPATPYDDLAHAFAPVIYQDVDNGAIGEEDGRFDLITRWDFDDADISNNWDSAGELPASTFLPWVYYSVVETRTHYYFGYFFYHPRDWESGDIARRWIVDHEHDFEGATVVVRKPVDGSDPDFDDIELVFTQAHDDTYYFLADSAFSVPDFDDESCLLTGSRDHLDHSWGSIKGPFSACDAEVESTALLSSIQDGVRRPEVFSESNGHGVGQIRRAWDSGEFYGGDGVVYSPADPDSMPTTPPDPIPPGVTSLKYGLLPLRTEIYDHRAGGNERIFSAETDDRTTITTIRKLQLVDVGHLFRGGNLLVSQGAHAPWYWPEHNSEYTQDSQVVADKDSRGDWLLDPAWMAQQHIDDLPAPGGPDWDVNYLHNPYMMAGNVLEVVDPDHGLLDSEFTFRWAWYRANPQESTGITETGAVYLVDPVTLARIVTVSDSLDLTTGSIDWVVGPTVSVGTYRLEVTCAMDVVPGPAAAPMISSISEPFAIVSITGTLPARRGAWLGPAVPNPFNPNTSIQFGVERPGHVEITVYDLAGRRVRNLVSGPVQAGDHSVDWDGRDGSGSRVASGVYLYVMRAQGYERARRVVLVK